MKKYAPIALFVYCRLEHTKRVVEGLLENQEAAESPLYIFSDGPKDDASLEMKNKIQKVKEYIYTISGFKNIEIEDYTHNQGLAQITINGMNKVFEQYSKAIMIEDDDVPSKYFLSYVNRCLDKYENDNTIWCVSGYIDNDFIPSKDGDDLFLANRPSSWGFGTWRRCWEKVIWDLETLKGIFRHKDVIIGYNRWGGTDSSKIMIETFSNMSNSWSIRYNFAAYLNKSYTIIPNKSLILSIGMDGTGTHGSNIGHVATMFEREVIIPDCIRFDSIRNKQLHDSFKGHSFRAKVNAFAEEHRLFHRIIYTLIRKSDPWEYE